MRIYITGGSGMLGHAFIKHFALHTLRTPGVNSPRIDIALDYEILRKDIAEFRPDAIINLAALCDMEGCERNPELALRTHVLGSGNLALIASDLSVKYVYLSSACVFDGKAHGYWDADKPHPISTYGKTKYMAEQIARSLPNHLIVRTEWCFGGGPQVDTKFVGKIYNQISAGKKDVYAVTDKRGSLSYLPDLCLAAERLLATEARGTFHICCTGSANRYEIAHEFVRLLGVDVRVVGVNSAYFSKEYDAPRPTSEFLHNTEIFGFSPRSWEECLAEYVKEFQK